VSKGSVRRPENLQAIAANWPFERKEMSEIKPTVRMADGRVEMSADYYNELVERARAVKEAFTSDDVDRLRQIADASYDGMYIDFYAGEGTLAYLTAFADRIAALLPPRDA
jgi:hypothetical protein